jgi:CRISPR/Cas system-associated endonuclease/helicase Cas3
MDFSFPLKTLRLNQEQSDAVLRDPDVHQRILASAGSGKTTTLTARIAYLITKHRIKPESIVLMTFSRNAAQQMKARIEDLIGPTNLWAGTFHGLCKSILEKHDPGRLGSLYFVDELIGMGASWLATAKGRAWVGKLRYIVENGGTYASSWSQTSCSWR